MYSSHLMLTNDSQEERTYHITKEETQNVPITALTINGQDYPYRIENNLLSAGVSLPAGGTIEIIIKY